LRFEIRGKLFASSFLAIKQEEKDSKSLKAFSVMVNAAPQTSLDQQVKPDDDKFLPLSFSL